LYVFLSFLFCLFVMRASPWSLFAWTLFLCSTLFRSQKAADDARLQRAAERQRQEAAWQRQQDQAREWRERLAEARQKAARDRGRGMGMGL
jgi:hypothetical protein